MPEPTTTKPGPNPVTAANPDEAVATMGQGPPEEEFWEKYNRRLEFPLATVGTVLLHVGIGALLVFLLLKLASSEDKSGVPIKIMEVAGIDSGEGSAGSGGEPDPFRDEGDPIKARVESMADPSKLPEVRENIRQTIKYFDESGKLPISDANAAAFAGLDDSMRKMMLGARKGAGPGQGSGTDGSKGKGPGGTGADSTLGRNLRWVLRFNVTDGRNYLDQLRVLEARVFFPLPGTGRGYLIEDLGAPEKHRIATEAEIGQFAGQLQFHDPRPAVVNSVLNTLKLDRGPSSICALFPKKVEEELARLERAYRNRRPEDIEETIFKITIRGGSPEIVVYDQKAKR